MKRGSLNNLVGKFGTGLMYAFLAFWSIVVIFPMVWVIVSAFKSDAEIFA